MKIVALSILVFVLNVFTPVQLLSQSNETESDFNPLTVEKLWEMKRIGSPVISPDGDWVVAPVTRYTIEDDKSQTDLWLFKTDGSVERPLTTHGSADGQPTFSPDGSNLAFVTSREGDDASQIYILPMDEPGEAVQLTEVPTGVNAPKWVGGHIYFISRIYPDMEWGEMADKLEEQKESHMSAHTWNEMPFSSWDRWIEEEREAHLFRISAEGGKPENITGPTGWQLPRSSQGAGNYDVSPDESLVAFNANSTRDETDVNIDLFLTQPGSTEAVNITLDNEAPDSNPLFSPDSRVLAYNSQQIKGFYGDTRQLVIYNIADDSSREVTTDWDRSADGLVWNPDGSSLFGAIDDARTRRVYLIPIDGSEPRAITGNTNYQSLDLSENGVLVAQNHSFLYPPRIVTVDTTTGETSRLDTINDDILDEVDLGTYESVTYEGANGKDIQMWVHYPPGFDENEEYPLFLLIHGGPHNAVTDGFHFRWNAQTFASWGYVTAWHNFHGSASFGQDFTDSINPDWVTLPYEDTIKAAEWFASKPWIDAERMVAGGGSYGGYLSSILLAKDHPFNALVIHAPVYNMYSQMAADFAVHSVRFGDYWEVPEIYESISPHYFAEDFSTPALIIHGQKDYRVPVGQAFELFRTLQTKGIDSRLIYYPDENHWILKPNNSIYWYNQVQKWVEEYAAPAPKP